MASEAEEQEMLAWRGHRAETVRPNERIWAAVIVVVVATLVNVGTTLMVHRDSNERHRQTRAVLYDAQAVGCRVLVLEAGYLYDEGPCRTEPVWNRIETLATGETIVVRSPEDAG